MRKKFRADSRFVVGYLPSYCCVYGKNEKQLLNWVDPFMSKRRAVHFIKAIKTYKPEDMGIYKLVLIEKVKTTQNK